MHLQLLTSNFGPLFVDRKFTNLTRNNDNTEIYNNFRAL